MTRSIRGPAVALLVAISFVACKRARVEGNGAVTEAGAPRPPNAGGISDGGAWSRVGGLVAEAVRAHSVPGLGLAVYDAHDNKVFEQMFGDFAPDRRVPIASASKMVSGLVFFHLIDKGTLTLDSTTGGVLGWRGPTSSITLRHLLSFTSGLDARSSCTLNPFTTLASCVETISRTTPDAPPGARFEYGPVHLAVAGRMAEVATGKSWNALFSEIIATPLGLPADVKYSTLPRAGAGSSNPLVAAGLHASMNEYRPLLAIAFHKGTLGATTIAKAAIFDAQASEPFPSAVIAGSPMKDIGIPFRYGLTAWLECPPPTTACAVLSSPGAWGFTPWFDRGSGYYAILGAFLENAAEDGVVDFSVKLAQDLKPAIRSALGK